MLAGPNLTLCQMVRDQGFDVIVSGGVSSNDDIQEVKKLNLSGVIIG